MATVWLIILVITGIIFFIFPWCYGEDWDWILVVAPWVLAIIALILQGLDYIFGIF